MIILKILRILLLLPPTAIVGATLPFTLGEIYRPKSATPTFLMWAVNIPIMALRWGGFILSFAMSLIFLLLSIVVWLIVLLASFSIEKANRETDWIVRTAVSYDQNGTAFIGGNEDLTISGWLGKKNRLGLTTWNEKLFITMFNWMDFTTEKHFAISIEEDEEHDV